MKERNLLSDENLEWSPVVANNTMNRERQAVGINSYAKDIRLNPIDFIENRLQNANTHWVDFCCGTAKALIQTANHFKNRSESSNIKITGYDLVDFFDSFEELPFLKLKQLNLSYWEPKEKYDLITMVHGLHYIGDKLGLLEKAFASLKPDGIFIANLDLENICLQDESASVSTLKKFMKNFGLDYNARSKILKCEGYKSIKFPFQYLGADDQAGPNYTGQPVVNSFYKEKH